MRAILGGMKIRGVLLDLSGVLYLADRVVPGAPEALARLRGAGLPLRFLSNMTRYPAARVREHLAGLGYRIGAEELFTPPRAVRGWLQAEGRRCRLLVHPRLEGEFEGLVDPAGDVLVVGDAAETFTYERLNTAFRALMDGAELVAMGDNRYFREPDGLSLDIGPFVHALEYASGRQARILGKPAAGFFHLAVADMGLAPDEVLMVGDDVESDVLGALEAGLQAALVRTGKYRPGDEQRLAGTPAWVADDLAAVVDRLLED